MRRVHFIGVLASIGVLIGAEVLIASRHVLLGQIADAVLLVLLVNAGRDRGEHERPEELDAGVPAMRALALVALVNVVAPALPLRVIPDGIREGLVALLIGIAALSAAPAVGVSLRAVLAMPAQRVLWSTSVGGLALGLGAYLLGAPTLATTGDTGGRILLALAAATIAALVEEFVFRGLVQLSLQRLAGRLGALAATGLFVSTYIGFDSVALVLVVALAGLLFAHSVARSGVLGAALAGHVLLAAGAVVVWPVLLGPEPAVSVPGGAIELGLAAAVVIGAAMLMRRPVTSLTP